MPAYDDVKEATPVPDTSDTQHESGESDADLNGDPADAEVEAERVFSMASIFDYLDWLEAGSLTGTTGYEAAPTQLVTEDGGDVTPESDESSRS